MAIWEVFAGRPTFDGAISGCTCPGVERWRLTHSLRAGIIRFADAAHITPDLAAPRLLSPPKSIALYFEKEAEWLLAFIAPHEPRRFAAPQRCDDMRFLKITARFAIDAGFQHERWRATPHHAPRIASQRRKKYVISFARFTATFKRPMIAPEESFYMGLPIMRLIRFDGASTRQLSARYGAAATMFELRWLIFTSRGGDTPGLLKIISFSFILEHDFTPLVAISAIAGDGCQRIYLSYKIKQLLF